MTGVKEQLFKLLANLPDDCTFEDVQYHLYIAARIRRAEDSIVHEGALTNDEVRSRFTRWLQK